MEFYYLLLTVLLSLAAGPVVCVNQACKNLGKCAKASTKAIKENDQEALCVSLKKSLDCIAKNVNECDYEPFAKPFKSTLEKTRKNYDKKCPKQTDQSMSTQDKEAGMDKGKSADGMDKGISADGMDKGYEASARPAGCAKLSKCLSPELTRAIQTNDDDVLCSETPKLLDCVKKVEDQCKDETVSKLTLDNFDQIEANYEKKCNGIAKLESSLSTILALACSVLVYFQLSRPNQ